MVCFASSGGAGFDGEVAMVIVVLILSCNGGGKVAVVWFKRWLCGGNLYPRLVLDQDS